MTTAVSWAEMQAEEKAWWDQYLASPNAPARMHMLYGARYMEFFWREFHSAGVVADIGCGPLPVAHLIHGTAYCLIDPLWGHDTIESVRDEAIDTALLLNVLDHTPDPAALARATYRMLKRGGKALVFVHVEQHEDGKHLPVSMAQAYGWLIDAGFTVERQWLKPANIFDPPAFLCVARKN